MDWFTAYGLNGSRYEPSGSMNAEEKPLSPVLLSRDIFKGPGKGTDLGPAIRQVAHIIHSASQNTAERHIFIIK